MHTRPRPARRGKSRRSGSVVLATTDKSAPLPSLRDQPPNWAKGGLLPRSESAGRAKDLPHLDKRVTVGLKLHPMSTGARASFGQIEWIFADAISAKAGTQRCGAPRLPWVPAFAGDGAMTRVSLFGTRYSVSADR
jgi:hypothetical protein